MDLQRFPSDRVISQLQQLKPGDYIKVRWRDASGFRDVNDPATVYYTPKESVGRFYKLIDDHLIIVNESSLGLHEGTTVPTGCIEKVKVLATAQGTKTPKKMMLGSPCGKSENVAVKIIEHIVKVAV